MPLSSPSALARALVVSALAMAGLAVGTTAEADASVVGGTCAPSLTQPVRLSDALDSGPGARALAARSSLDADTLLHLAEDETSWVDRCGQVYVVDEATPGPQQAVADAPSATLPDDVFDLSSRPGSDRTIYLDFDGATHSGTHWANGAEIVSPAYSIDADPASFSETERAQVFLAWQVVAEDFAAFDVNVTTRTPPASALTRSSAGDRTYGMPVVVTPTNTVGDGCDCGGSAYVGVFGARGATDAQPAWVFTRGAGTRSRDLGEVISHEVGHTFGLAHDGTSTSSYYAGDRGWAPIMGSSYGRRASQWSRGEYADASNTEDDLAIIAATAPLLTDDHAGGPLDATRIAVGSTTDGVITTRTDTDAFTFTAGGPVTLRVAGPATYSDLDVRLTVLDALGAAVAVVDPVADTASDESLAATWVSTATSTSTWTVVVDGTCSGDPRQAGRYSDYGSIGAYAVSLAAGLPAADPPTPVTQPTPTQSTMPSASPAPAATVPATPTPTVGAPVAARFLTTRLPRARVGKAYRAVIRFAGPVTEARVDRRLPLGLRWRVVGSRIVIRGTVRRAGTSRFATILASRDGSVRQQLRIVVR